MKRDAVAAAALVLLVSGAGCFSMRPSSGGGQSATFTPPRRTQAADIALPAGYRIEAVAAGLTFPTGVAFDEKGTPYVVESGYSYGEVWATPRLLRISSGGKTELVAAGARNGPWNGVAFAGGNLWVAEGGELEGGRILRISPSGTIERVVEGLPSLGDHHTDGPAAGPDGWIYFGQGTATNSGVVGEDNAKFGWLKRHPEFHDTPCKDVTLVGQNFETKDASTAGGGRTIATGAFSAYGTSTAPNAVVRGAVPCNGAIFRVRPEGGPPELVAWGFRNPFGLAFAPDGRLYVSENGYDDRGSRPVHGAADVIWLVQPGTWYGWPDYSAGRRLDDGDHFDPPHGPKPRPLLASPPNRPPQPIAALGVHSSSNGIDFSRSEAFGYLGQLFIAQFGDMAPDAGKTISPVGFKVRRLDVSTGVSEDFAVNRGAQNGPATRLKTGGLERPVAVRFDPAGTSLYVVDFGVMTMSAAGPSPQPGTGVLWRITREAGSR
ncbi:MAG: sorbosone dehydrogenase family protein [Thermoanaerobaculia bacterium]